MAITQKQENFCLKYVECGNASEAYRHAYKAEKMTDKQVWEEASKLLKGPKVSQRVAELKEMHTERHKITVDELLAELEENRQAALQAETAQASAATAATMGKAKLLGLDKQIIENTHRVIDDGSHEW